MDDLVEISKKAPKWDPWAVPGPGMEKDSFGNIRRADPYVRPLSEVFAPRGADGFINHPKPAAVQKPKAKLLTRVLRRR